MSGTNYGPATEVARPNLMLALATIGFAVNFWAWALISPLGPLFREQGTLGTLSESDVALMVAVPVIVSSLGRIVVGALTDKLGGRLMFPIVSGVTIIPILFLAFFALDSYGAGSRSASSGPPWAAPRYLTRPYIVYRSRDVQLGSHRPRRGWGRVG
jgi:MFS family permease